MSNLMTILGSRSVALKMDKLHGSCAMYVNNSKLTETKSPPLPFAATKMATNLALFKKPIMHDPSQFKQVKDAHEWNICHLHTVGISRAQDL